MKTAYTPYTPTHFIPFFTIHVRWAWASWKIINQSLTKKKETSIVNDACLL